MEEGDQVWGEWRAQAILFWTPACAIALGQKGVQTGQGTLWMPLWLACLLACKEGGELQN